MGLNDEKLCAYDGQPAEDPVTLLCGTVYSRRNVLRLWKKQHKEMTGDSHRGVPQCLDSANEGGSARQRHSLHRSVSQCEKALFTPQGPQTRCS